MQIFLNATKVHYKIVGKGQYVVLLHGFCEDSSMWTTWVDILQHSFCVVTIDLAGFGGSGVLPNTSMATMADAVEAVLTKEQIHNCFVFGHSMGGYVALELLAKRSINFLGMGMIHSHPFTDPPEKIANRRKTMAFIKRHGVGPFAGPFVRSLFTPSFCNNNKKFIESLIYHTSTHHNDAIIAASEAMINRKDHSKLLKETCVPILFIVGREDKAIPSYFSMAQLTLPSFASVHVIEDVAHMAMYEVPKKSLFILKEFIKRCNKLNTKVAISS